MRLTPIALAACAVAAIAAIMLVDVAVSHETEYEAWWQGRALARNGRVPRPVPWGL